MSYKYPEHFKLPFNQPNFFERYIDNWTQVIDQLLIRMDEKEPRVAIEIGSLNGSSAVWTLENFITRPGDILHCIDINETEYLRENLEPYRDRVQMHLGLSSDVLIDLWRYYKRPVADLVYVDGSHIARHVLEDGVLGWKLLKKERMIIFDDYSWGTEGKVDDQPRTGVDAFLHGYQNHWKIIGKPSWGQVYLLKLSYDLTERQLVGNYAIDNPFFNKENL